MRNLIFVIAVSFSPFALGAKIAPSFKIEFINSKAKVNHVYTISGPIDRSRNYTLSWKKEDGKVHKKRLSSTQALRIQAEGARIQWENNYRKPASLTPGKCRLFAKIWVYKDETKICLENTSTTGQTSGLLYSLRRHF